jgi:hypothetical protein
VPIPTTSMSPRQTPRRSSTSNEPVSLTGESSLRRSRLVERIGDPNGGVVEGHPIRAVADVRPFSVRTVVNRETIDLSKAQVIVSIGRQKCVTDLQVPPRTEPMTLPAPTLGLVGDRAPMPPPPLREPAVTPPLLPPLTGVPIVPPMPRFSLDEIDADAPPVVGAPTMGTTVVDVIPGASPSEPLGGPPAVAMVMPSLPSVAAAPPPSETPAFAISHHPVQRGVPMTSLADATNGSTAKPLKTGRGFGRTMVRTIFAVVLAGALGVGAHLGYDWWEQRDAAGSGVVAVDGSDLMSWPQVDPPAIRYTDSVTTFRDSTGVRTLTAHREIASSRTQAMVQSTDVAGTDLGTVEVDYRGEQSFIRTTPESPWAVTSQDDALAQIGDTWTEDVFTVTDVFPAAAAPYMTVLESVERVLPVRPLAPAVDPNAPVETPMATSTDPTSMVWQYRVIIDVESFRANETAAHQEWTRRLGRNAVPRIEAWIDATGIVRQLSVDVDGTVVTHTLIGGAANSTRFDGNPLLGTEPLAAAPAVVPAPLEADE